MPQPLVIAYHLVWTAYGWWLPNDPRGSGSKQVCCDVIAELGALHFGRKRIQPPADEIKGFYDKAAQLLQHSLLTFDDKACAEIAEAFDGVIEEQSYTCYACAIMPDHVHILIRKHKHQAEEMMGLLRSLSRKRLVDSGRRAVDHPVWTSGSGWKVFLDHPQEVRRTIGYIDQNPVKIGWPKQYWPFVKEYNNWPLHPGHSPNSPYAKALRAVGRHP
jgi:REP element-mobilizing transposase RayT